MQEEQHNGVEKPAAPSLRFDDPKYDQAMYDVIHAVILGFVDSDPLMSKISQRPIQHAGPMRGVAGYEVVDRPLEAVESVMEVNHDSIRNTDLESLTTSLYEMSQSYIQALHTSLIQLLREITDATGNVINLEGKSPTFDDCIDMIELMDIGFDDDGNPILPTVLIGPEEYEKIKETTIPTPEQTQRMNEVLARKKSEYNAQKRTRRLS